MYDDPVTDLSPSAPEPEPDDDRATRLAPSVGWASARPDDRHPVTAWVCPFLRAIDEDDALLAPVETPDPANRCVAVASPVPQSLRQQELVCLSRGHVNCPRYLRGSYTTPASEIVPAPLARPSLSRATGVSLLALAASSLLAFAFVVSNGGLVLTVAATATPRDDPGAGSTPGPTWTAAPSPTPTPSPSHLTPGPT